MLNKKQQNNNIKKELIDPRIPVDSRSSSNTSVQSQDEVDGMDNEEAVEFWK